MFALQGHLLLVQGERRHFADSTEVERNLSLLPRKTQDVPDEGHMVLTWCHFLDDRET